MDDTAFLMRVSSAKPLTNDSVIQQFMSIRRLHLGHGQGALGTFVVGQVGDNIF